MKSFKYTFIIILLVILLFLVTGCWDRGSKVRDTALSEPGIENNNEASSEGNVETIARRGPSDRLPGSLQWGSIIIFQNGEDFLLDYPDQGLSAVNLVSTAGRTTASGDKSATTEPGSTETKSTEAKSTETEATKTEGDGTKSTETKSAENENTKTESTENDGFSGTRTITDENGITKTVIYRDGEIVMEIVYEGDNSGDSTNTRHDPGTFEKRGMP